VSRIVMGYFEDRPYAEEIKAKIQAAGYKDAFIAVHKGKVQSTCCKPAYLIGKEKEEISKPKTLSDSGLKENELYVIELGAYKRLGDVPALSLLSDLGQIYIEQNGEVSTLILGSYDSKVSADKAFAEAVKAGFKEAKLEIVDKTSVKAEAEVKTDAKADVETVKDTGIQDQGEPQKPTTMVETTKPPKSTPPAKPAPTSAKKVAEKVTVTIPTDKSTTVSVKETISVATKPATANVKTTTLPAPVAPPTPPPAPKVVIKRSVPAYVLPNYSNQTGVSLNPNFKNPDLDLTELSLLFKGVDFQILNIGNYDPTQEKTLGKDAGNTALMEKNNSLKGKRISPSLVYLFEGTPDLVVSSKFYALYDFDLDPNHIGYVVRTGNGKFDQNNHVFLYVFSRISRSFVGRELLSTVANEQGKFGKTQSWMTDLNKDGIKDVLTHHVNEFYDASTNYNKQEVFVAKVWQNGKFIGANISNEASLKQQLNLK
ncbi:MAG: hypothetical protein ACPGXL_05805, partial [Chitinophagales bacterium]